MKVSEAYPTKYISASDLNGKTAKVIIANCAMEKVGEDQKPVLYFNGKQKGLALNKTNANNIAHAYGDEMDEWRGAEVELFTALVDYQGKTVEAVRVRVPPRKAGGNAAPSQQMHDDEIGF